MLYGVSSLSRGISPHLGKTEVRVYDYVDGRVPVLKRMFERRLKGYRTLGYMKT